MGTLLKESRFCVSNVPLLRERGHAISTADLALDHSLELTQARISVFEMEHDVSRPYDLDDILCMATLGNLVTDNADFEINRVHDICRARFIIHHFN